MLTVADIAERIEARLEGDGQRVIATCAGLEEAGPDAISFLADPREVERARKSKAGALIVPEGVEGLEVPLLRVANPRLAFARTLALFAPPRSEPEGIHPTSVVHPGARIGEGVAIGPCAVVEEGAVIGDRVKLYAGVYVGRDAEIGDDSTVYPNAVIGDRVKVGRRCVVQAGAVIGSDGFGYVTVDGRHEKIPHIGTVVLEDEVEIGALTAIDRATSGVTRVGRGTKIDNLVQVAHNVQIGEGCLVAGLVGLAGSARLGRGVVMGGQAALADHAVAEDGAVLAARSGVISKAPAHTLLSGFPARPHPENMRIWAATQRLPELVKTVRDLSARVRALEAALAEMDGAVVHGHEPGEDGH